MVRRGRGRDSTATVLTRRRSEREAAAAAADPDSRWRQMYSSRMSVSEWADGSGLGSSARRLLWLLGYLINCRGTALPASHLLLMKVVAPLAPPFPTGGAPPPQMQDSMRRTEEASRRSNAAAPSFLEAQQRALEQQQERRTPQPQLSSKRSCERGRG